MEDTGISMGDALGLMKSGGDGTGDWGGGGIFTILLLFVLMMAFGGGLGFGGRGPAPSGGEPVTEAGLCNAMNFNNLENAVGRLSDKEDLHMMQLSQGLSSVGYESLRNFADTQATVKDGDYALSRQVADCCCTTQRAIDAVNANVNERFAALEKGQLQQTIAAQQNQLNQLQLASQLCGVPRVSPYGYSIVPSFPAQPAGCGAAWGGWLS